MQKKKAWKSAAFLAVGVMAVSSACAAPSDSGAKTVQKEEAAPLDQSGEADAEDGQPEIQTAAVSEELQEEGKDMDIKMDVKELTITKGYKGINDTNPLMTQRFGADPYAMVYKDRVYIYMTADAFEYDSVKSVKENTYSKIHQINVISTDDMVNFTDHGSVNAASGEGAAKWARNSWAPAAAWKEIDGKTSFSSILRTRAAGSVSCRRTRPRDRSGIRWERG